MTNSLVSLEKISEPLTKLIEVVSSGIGELYSPLGVVRSARAEAKAKLINAQADLDVDELMLRANNRIEYRETLRQKNIERIAAVAREELPSSVSAEEVDKSWAIQFFDGAQDVCDESIQNLWARILAGEIESPGSYSKRTLQFLKTLDKWEAEAFSNLCSFAFTDKGGWRFLFELNDSHKEIVQLLGQGDYLNHFVSIGLLAPEEHVLSASGMTGVKVSYFEQSFIMEGPPKKEETGTSLPVWDHFGARYFTQIGQQLAKIAGAQARSGYVDLIAKELQTECQLFLKKQ